MPYIIFKNYFCLKYKTVIPGYCRIYSEINNDSNFDFDHEERASDAHYEGNKLA